MRMEPFVSFLSEFKRLLNKRGIGSLIGVSMSFCLLYYQSACVSSIWCWACWLFSYYLSTQLYHKTALLVAAIAEPTINVLGNGDAMPCPPFSLVVWCWTRARSQPPHLDGTLFLSLHVTKHLRWMGRQLQAWLFFRSQHNSRQSSGVEPFGGLYKSTLNDFLKSDHDYLQRPRLLSQFKSIDHEKNISSCIARVAALGGTFENRPVGGGNLDPRSLILIWNTGASYGLTLFCSSFFRLCGVWYSCADNHQR